MLRTAAGPYLQLSPQLTEDLIVAVRESVAAIGPRAPLVVVDVAIRAFLRRLVELEFASLHVLSRQDIEPGTPVVEVARVGSVEAAQDGFRGNGGATP